jgi:ribonuclease Z
MEILFVGTGSGKTSLKRNHSSILIYDNGYNLLIDSGDGISKALLQQNIEINSINSVIITHLHADHYSGIASLTTQMKLLKREKPFSIYIHKNFADVIRSFLNSVYMFSETIGFNLNIMEYDFEKLFLLNNNISLAAIQNSHVHKKEETKFYPDEMFVSSSLLLRCNNKNIFYASDVGSAEDLYLFKNKSVDIMITECSHVSLDEIFASFQKLKPNKLYITHISDELETQMIQWHHNLPIDNQEQIFLCHDGLSVIPA